MIQQYFLPYKTSVICATLWLGNSNKNILLCPPVCSRSMAGIRYYTGILARTLAKNGFNVMTFDYPGTGNSGGDMAALSLPEALAASKTVYRFMAEINHSAVDLIIGVAAGNFIASLLAAQNHLHKIILLNPDYESIQPIYQDLMNRPLDIQEESLSGGYLETQYYRMTENGSEATFSVLDLENPDPQLRFWDALVGPFFGGESEAVSCKLVKDLAKMDYDKILADLEGEITVFYWGKWFLTTSMAQNFDRITKINCGHLSNLDYWLKSSQLFDKTIAEVCRWVVNDIGPGGPATNPGDFKQYERTDINNHIFMQAYSVTVGGEQILGILHGPSEATNAKLPIIVFEHGLCCDSVAEFRAFYTTSMRLAENGYYSFRYDHLGTGVSDGEFVDTTHQDYLEELLSVISALDKSRIMNLDNIILISWSFGACISWLAAQREPRVKGLILWSPVICEISATTKIKLFRSPRGQYVFPISPLWLSREFLKYEKKLDLTALYDSCSLPTLLITGEYDNVNCYQYIAERISGRSSDKHIIIKGSGHCFSQSTIHRVIEATVARVKEYQVAQ